MQLRLDDMLTETLGTKALALQRDATGIKDKATMPYQLALLHNVIDVQVVHAVQRYQVLMTLVLNPEVGQLAGRFRVRSVGLV